MSCDNGPLIECVKCGKPHGLFQYGLDEAATLTCPTCGTKVSLTATLKEPVNAAGAEMGLQGKPLAPFVPPSAPAPPPPPLAGGSTAPPAAGGSPPVESVRVDVSDICKRLDAGTSADDIVKVILGETDEEKMWKGDLSTFNTKLQSLVKDLGYKGDLGDLVADFQEGEALILRGENVHLDLEKAKEVLVKELLGRDADGDTSVDIEGEVLPSKWSPKPFPETEPSAVATALSSPSKSGVSKALDTYFG